MTHRWGSYWRSVLVGNSHKPYYSALTTFSAQVVIDLRCNITPLVVEVPVLISYALFAHLEKRDLNCCAMWTAVWVGRKLRYAQKPKIIKPLQPFWEFVTEISLTSVKYFQVEFYCFGYLLWLTLSQIVTHDGCVMFSPYGWWWSFLKIAVSILRTTLRLLFAQMYVKVCLF